MDFKLKKDKIKKIKVTLCIDEDIYDLVHQLKNEGYDINISKILNDALKEYTGVMKGYKGKLID